MPCFDQPDLKSNMTLIVYTHEMWQAASVSAIQGIDHMIGEHTIAAYNSEHWMLEFV